MPRPVPGGSGFPVSALPRRPIPLRHPPSPRPRPTAGGCLILRPAPPGSVPCGAGSRTPFHPGGGRRGWRRLLAQWELVQWLQNGYIYTNDTDFLRTPRGWREFKDFIPRARGLGGLSVRLRLRSGSPGCEVERRTRSLLGGARSSLCPTPLFSLREPQRPFLLLTRTNAESGERVRPRDTQHAYRRGERGAPRRPHCGEAGRGHRPAQPEPSPRTAPPRAAQPVHAQPVHAQPLDAQPRAESRIAGGRGDGTPAPSARLLVVLGTDYSR